MMYIQQCFYTSHIYTPKLINDQYPSIILHCSSCKPYCNTSFLLKIQWLQLPLYKTLTITITLSNFMIPQVQTTPLHSRCITIFFFLKCWTDYNKNKNSRKSKIHPQAGNKSEIISNNKNSTYTYKLQLYITPTHVY